MGYWVFQQFLQFRFFKQPLQQQFNESVIEQPFEQFNVLFLHKPLQQQCVIQQFVKPLQHQFLFEQPFLVVVVLRERAGVEALV